MEVSDIVESLNGRDSGKLFYVVSIEDEYVLIADGKGRKLEKPKRKKQKHMRLVASGDGRTAEKLRIGEKVQNSEIRRALAAFAAGTGEGGL